MKKKLLTAFSAILFVQPPTFAQPKSGESNLNISTLKAVSAKWTNERDLSLLFEQTDNRILLAEYIISECINSNTLSELARVDGLRIAGHICYRDGSYENAKTAFSALRDLDSSPRWNSEALRMLAQLSMNDPDLDITIGFFNDALDFALQDDPNGDFLSTKSLLNTLCSLNSATGNHNGALETALVGIDLFSSPNTQREKAQFIYWAYLANKNLGDHPGALYNLNDLLENHPEFQADNDIHGIPPLLRIDQFILRGQGWERPSEDFIYEILDICYDPEYQLMPSRLLILEKFGKLLERNDQFSAAINIRSTLRNELSTQLDTNNSINPLLKTDLRNRLARLALDDARLLLKTGDPAGAFALLSEINSPQTQLPEEILNQISQLRETAEDLLPVP